MVSPARYAQKLGGVPSSGVSPKMERESMILLTGPGSADARPVQKPYSLVSPRTCLPSDSRSVIDNGVRINRVKISPQGSLSFDDVFGPSLGVEEGGREV